MIDVVQFLILKKLAFITQILAKQISISRMLHRASDLEHSLEKSTTAMNHPDPHNVQDFSTL